MADATQLRPNPHYVLPQVQPLGFKVDLTICVHTGAAVFERHQSWCAGRSPARGGTRNPRQPAEGQWLAKGV